MEAADGVDQDVAAVDGAASAEPMADMEASADMPTTAVMISPERQQLIGGAMNNFMQQLGGGIGR